MMKAFTIYSKKGEYASFPSLAIKDNTIYCAFRLEARSISTTHLNTRSVARIKVSKNRGKNWKTLVDIKSKKQCGIQDPSLAVLKTGELILNYFTWCGQKHTRSVQKAVMSGPFIRVSTNNGQNWGKEISVKPNALSLATSEPIIQTGKDFLMPCYGNMGGGSETALIIGSSSLTQWEAIRKIAQDKDGRLNLQEPALLNCGQGHILCMMRVPLESGTALFQAHSWDNGVSWEPFKHTGIIGFPPNLLRLVDGRILVTYGYRRRPFGIRACLSKDEGITWQTNEEIILRTDGGGWDIGYPSSVQFGDGSILTAYYFHTKKNKTRRVLCTRWKVGKT